MNVFYPYLAVAVITMFVAFVMTDLLKRLFGVINWPKSDKLNDLLLKTFAAVVGGGAGFLSGGASPIVEGWPVGFLVGLGAGGLCTWGVSWFKSWAKQQRVNAVRLAMGPDPVADIIEATGASEPTSSTEPEADDEQPKEEDDHK